MLDERALAAAWTGDATAASAAALVTAVALVGLLVSDWRCSRLGVWIAKPLASLGFVGVALAAGALESRFGLLMLTGLVLCLGGDVLLIPRERPHVFIAGVGSFLLGHVAYAVAFGSLGLELPVAAGAGVLLACFVAGVLRWLAPHVPDAMRWPVRAYIVVISCMGVSAAGASAAGASPLLAVGALLFIVSDLGVARDRFVRPGLANALWGLPLYYAGQLVLAASIGVVPR